MLLLTPLAGALGVIEGQDDPVGEDDIHIMPFSMVRQYLHGATEGVETGMVLL